MTLRPAWVRLEYEPLAMKNLRVSLACALTAAGCGPNHESVLHDWTKRAHRWEIGPDDAVDVGTRDEVLAFIRDSDKVVLVFRSRYWDDKEHPPRFREITRPGAVRKITSLVVLEAKKACQCRHDQTIVFYRGQAFLSASVCDHCFDVLTKQGTQHYKMPRALWKRF